MVNIFTSPGQALEVGVTRMVAFTGKAVVLTDLKDAIFPVPEAANPIET
jgi:hypothetical protein